MWKYLLVALAMSVPARDASRTPVAIDEIHQTPQPYVPPDPVKYPEDYCADFSDTDEFDYVVVGAGPGGATVARRLAEDPKIKVLLLEAGGNPPPNTDLPAQTGNVDYEHLWHFHSVDGEDLCTGTAVTGCEYTPAKMLGGSSIINGMMYVRGNRKDYDDWAKIGCTGWSYKDVLPYFKKSEKYSVHPLLSTRQVKKSKNPDVADRKYHGTTGPLHHSAFPNDPNTYAFRMASTQAQIENGIKYNADINGATQMGVSEIGGMVDPSGYRNSVARAFLLHIPDNLKVCKYSTAMKIDLKGKKAVGVDFRYNGTGEVKNYKAKAKREYIISAGPLNSAPLLERSGIGRKEVLQKVGVELKHELPGVGENYQDHLKLKLFYKLDFQSAAAQNPLCTELSSFTSFLNTSDPHSSVPDIQLLHATFTPAKSVGMTKEVADELNSLFADGKSMIYVIVGHTAHPNPGSIHITQTEDPTISPEIITNHLTTQYEKDRITKAAKLVRKFMSSDVLKPFKVEPVVLKKCQQYEFNTQDEIICQMRVLASSFYHIVGMASMGPKDNPNAVVDPELRVRGLDNVRVVDSSIMPLVTRGNTEIPTVMIAEKAADMIKNSQKKSKF